MECWIKIECDERSVSITPVLHCSNTPIADNFLALTKIRSEI